MTSANSQTRTSYPLSVFVNSQFAQPFACVACHNIPSNPLTNSDGEIYCAKCAETKEQQMNESPVVKRMIMNMKVKCLNGVRGGEEEEGVSMVVASETKSNSNSVPANISCPWTGPLHSFPSHSSSCSLRVVLCPFASIGCPGDGGGDGYVSAHSLADHMSSNLMQHIMMRVERVEEEVRVQRERNRELESNVSKLQVEVQEQKVTIQRLTEEQQNSNQEIQQLKAQNNELKEMNGALQQKVVDVESEVQQQKEQIRQLQQKCEEQQGINSRVQENIRQIDAQCTEVEEMVGKMGKNEVAVFKTTQGLQDNKWIRWNVTKISPTLNGMMRFTDHNKHEIQIEEEGLYRVFYRMYSHGGNTGTYAQLHVNGNCVDWSYHSQSYGHSSLMEVMNIRKGDRIKCYALKREGNEEFHCVLIIERMGDCV